MVDRNMYVVAKTTLDVTSGLQWLVVTHNSHSVKSKYSAMKVRQGHIVCSNPSKLAHIVFSRLCMYLGNSFSLWHRFIFANALNNYKH